MSASDLKQIFTAARPSVEAWLDAAKEFAAFRDACRAKGIDWSAVKALLKASIQDAEEGTDKRVSAIIDKAEFASSYADMLGLINKKNISRDEAA